ncbi:major facilitator superfamily transporter [Ceratobasidium sp. AG-Ba]|nr:major facilitator superfamily transporter [Ceratobasidium sp. AG-Ba]
MFTNPRLASRAGSRSPEKSDPERVSISSDDAGLSHPLVGNEELWRSTRPHDNYEGLHRWDPTATWDAKEEKALVRKIDIRLMTWLCLMFFGLQIDRGNIGNALTDNFLKDLKLTTNDYNNGTTIQLLAFLRRITFTVHDQTAGMERWLPGLMVCWSMVSWAQAWITNRTSFYITRALIGAFEGGFIPGVILYATYWYTSKELAIRLSWFWATLNVARIATGLLASGILQMRGIRGMAGWFTERQEVIAINMLALSKSSDYFGDRSFHVLLGELWSLGPLIALAYLPKHASNWVRFTISTLIAGYPYFHPIVTSWVSENSFDVKKRAVAAATYNVIVQMGSVVSSQLYRADDAPLYYRANKILFSICIGSATLVAIQRWWLRRLNNAKARAWDNLTQEQQIEYQADEASRELEATRVLINEQWSVLEDYHDLLALYLFAPSPVFNRTSASMADLGDSSLTLVRPSPKIKQETPSPRVQDGRKAEDDSSNRRVVSRYFAKTEEEKKAVKVGGSSEAGDKQLKGKYSEAEAGPGRARQKSQTSLRKPDLRRILEGSLVVSPGPSGSRAATKTSNRRQKRKSETAHEEVYTDSAQEVVTDTEPAVHNPGAKKKKRRTKRGYAPPEVYAHLNFVQDCIGYGLDILFCGINPGQKSAGSGHHFAGPTNGFWKCLHQGGLTDRLILPSEDHIAKEV